jgi:hypothetical protein
LNNTAISTAGAITTGAATSNSVGGVTLNNTAISTAGAITTGAATSNSVGGVTLNNTAISTAGAITTGAATSNSVGGVTLSNTRIVPQTATGQIAIGSNAGSIAQGQSAVAIGENAGLSNQTQFAVAIGASAGMSNQGNYSVAIGVNSGYASIGTNSITIGYNAGSSPVGSMPRVGATSNTIVINAIGTGWSDTTYSTVSGFYVAPIRNATLTLSGLASLAYNPTTKEVVQRGFGQIIAYGSINYTQSPSYGLARGGTITNTGATFTFTLTTALPDRNFLITYGAAQNITFFTTARSSSNFSFSNSADRSDIIVDFTVVY